MPEWTTSFPVCILQLSFLEFKPILAKAQKMQRSIKQYNTIKCDTIQNFRHAALIYRSPRQTIGATTLPNLLEITGSVSFRPETECQSGEERFQRS